MNFDNIYDALVQIDAETKKAPKQALLKSCLDHPNFKKVCLFALNPYMRFGVKPELDRPGKGQSNTLDLFLVLEKLAKREITGNNARDLVDNTYGFASEKTGKVFTRILRKNLRAGFTANSVNKAHGVQYRSSRSCERSPSRQAASSTSQSPASRSWMGCES